MGKLYSVSVEFVMVVEAESETAAYSVARNEMREAVFDCEAEIFVGSEIKNVNHLPDDWDGECLPYGGDGSTRIAQILHERSK